MAVVRGSGSEEEGRSHGTRIRERSAARNRTFPAFPREIYTVKRSAVARILALSFRSTNIIMVTIIIRIIIVIVRRTRERESANVAMPI